MTNSHNEFSDEKAPSKVLPSSSSSNKSTNNESSSDLIYAKLLKSHTKITDKDIQEIVKDQRFNQEAAAREIQDSLLQDQDYALEENNTCGKNLFNYIASSFLPISLFKMCFATRPGKPLSSDTSTYDGRSDSPGTPSHSRRTV